MAETTGRAGAPVRFQAGHASGSEWDRIAQGCLDSMGPIDPAANLGFLYASDPLAGHMLSLLAFLRDKTGIEHWVGTIGIGVLGGGREYFDEAAMTVMTASLPRGSFQVMPGINDEGGPLASEVTQWLGEHQAALGLIHADPRNPELPQLLGDLGERTGAFLVGGLTSSRGRMRQLADGLVEGGVSGLLVSDEVRLATGLTQGCMPIGPVRSVTKTHRNVVLTIDGRSALEVLREDMGDLLLRDSRALDSLHVALPVPGSDTRDYLVRNIIGLDTETGAVAVGDLLDPGDRLMFCRRDRESAEADLRRMLEGMRERIGAPVRGGVYVSCLARGPNLFGPGSRELRIISEELGNFPLVGFFANGEISHNRLYGYTGVLTLFY